MKLTKSKSGTQLNFIYKDKKYRVYVAEFDGRPKLHLCEKDRHGNFIGLRIFDLNLEELIENE